MPRDGAGVFSLPSAAFVAGTTIASAAVNADFSDLVTDANAARPATAGGTGGTSVIAGHDGLVAAGTAIPSGSSINLDTATGPLIDISGTTTITAVTLGAGKQRFARATGAFQMTASASLLVNGSNAANYTTQAGDLIIFEGYAGPAVYAWVVSGIGIYGLFAKLAGNQTLSGGFNVTSGNLGTLGNFTIAPLTNNLQYGTLNSSITITAPATDCVVVILITNGASAAAPAFSGFAVGANTGDTYATTNGNKYFLVIMRINGVSTYRWVTTQ